MGSLSHPSLGNLGAKTIPLSCFPLFHIVLAAVRQMTEAYATDLMINDDPSGERQRKNVGSGKFERCLPIDNQRHSLR